MEKIQMPRYKFRYSYINFHKWRWLLLLEFLSFYYTPVYSKDKVCAPYYDYIYVAERNIYNNKLQNALNYYDSAFLSSNRVVDLFNASCAALYLLEYPKAYSYLHTYFKKGARYYPDSASFKKYFPNLPLTVYDSIIRLKNSFELPYSKVTKMLDSLYEIDQIYYKGKAQGLTDSAWYYNRLNHAFLMNYIRQNGFSFETDSFIAYGNSIRTPKYWVLFHHFFQASIMDSSDVKFLKNEVCKGNILPETFADWWETYVNYDELGNRSIWLYFPESKDTSLWEYAKLYKEKGEIVFGYDRYDNEKKQTIDRKRKEFHLESMEMVKKKMKFMLTDPVYSLTIPRFQLDVIPKQSNLQSK